VQAQKRAAIFVVLLPVVPSPSPTQLEWLPGDLNSPFLPFSFGEPDLLRLRNSKATV
jgi:hypothetical protein